MSADKRAALAWYYKMKNTSCCKKCNENHPATLEFHRRDPRTKVHTVSQMVRAGFPLRRIFEEASKCDILCSNCHKITHWEEARGIDRDVQPSGTFYG